MVGLINSNGITYVGYGVSSLETAAPVTEDSVFEIGSITKTFTCTLLSQHVLDGSMVLTGAVKNYLKAGATVPQRNGKQITLQHLATHRSGLPRMPTNWNPATALDPYVDYTVDNMYDFLAAYSLPRDPDADFEYSNFGMGLVGYALALHNARDYETLVRERITDKLGLADTAVTLTAHMASNFTTGYSGVMPVGPWSFGPSFIGAGALRSSTRDLLHYVAANMGIVSSELHAAMTNAHAARASAFPGTSIGLGWLLSPVGTDQMIWHDGATGGWRSYAGFLKKRGLGVVVLSNSDFGVDDIGAHLLDPSQAMLTLPAPPAVNTETLRGLVGRFQDDTGKYYFDISLLHGHLVAAFSEDKGVAFTLYPRSAVTYYPTIVQATGTFQTNGVGVATKLIWTQSGVSQPFTRASLPARLSILRSNNTTQISFSGDTGISYVTEASPDLVNWTAISTNTIWNLPAVESSNAPARFYRLRRQ